MPIRDEALVQRMATEVLTLTADRGVAILSLAPIQFVHLVGLVQLASRHPGVQERETIRAVVDAARAYFAGCPAVLEVVRRGEDPAEDC